MPCYAVEKWIDSDSRSNNTILYMVVSASGILMAAAAAAGIVGLICYLRHKRHQPGGIYFFPIHF